MKKNRPFRRGLKSRKRFQRLLGDRLKKTGLRCGLVVLKKGERVGEHKTEGREEAIIILQGKARICYGRKRHFDVGEETFIYLPLNTVHDVENIGSGLLRYVYVTSKVK